MCQVPSHASLSVKQINEQHKVGSGEGDLNFGSKIIAWTTLIPHSRVIERVEVNGRNKDKEGTTDEESDWNPGICSQHYDDFHRYLQESVIISSLAFTKYFVDPSTMTWYFTVVSDLGFLSGS